MSAAIRTGVVAVVGNPRPASRTAAVARAVAEHVAGHLHAGLPHVVDLASSEPPLGADAPQRLASELQCVSTAAVVVVASPTYKASYTGLLKAFLDLLPPAALYGAVAIPVMTLAGSQHTLAADVHLRPVLQELGASLPTASLVLTEAALADVDGAVEGWWADAAPTLAGIGSIDPRASWRASVPQRHSA